MKKLLMALVFLLLAGCSPNTAFIYKPGAPGVGGPQLPLKVAVLPFKDGTEDFTKRGFLLNLTLTINLAKTGYSQTIDALTPDLWARAFADDLASSGDFSSVRFFYSSSELTNEDLYIEGTIKKANFNGAVDQISDFALSLRALRRADNQLVWEKEVTRSWKSRNAPATISLQTIIDDLHAQINQVLQEMFGEARADLVRALRAQSERRAEKGATQSAASPPPLESEAVDEEIEKILQGK